MARIERTDVALRINADHARATAFLIHDGVLPSNEGRGYVLRKIMRRAIRNARMIGRDEPYLYELTGFVAELMKPGYPEMMESIQRVARVVKDEEHRYATTFQVAEKVFVEEAKSAASGVLPAPLAFKLYDTYGLALDEQEEMARERGLTIDHAGFHAEMEKQRTRARASWKGADKAQVNPDLSRPCLRPNSSAARRFEAPAESGARPRARGRSSWSRSHAVLCRSRRPGGRYWRADFAGTRRHGRDGRTTRTIAGAGNTRPTCDGSSRRSDEGDKLIARSTAICATPPCAITPPRICCTPRCAKCSDRTSSRPAASSIPSGCASTSRITRTPIPTSWPRFKSS